MTTLIDKQMELAEAAKKVEKPKVADAERERQKKFYEQLRARKAAQPKGAQYE